MAESEYTLLTRRILRGFASGQSAEEVSETINHQLSPAQTLVRAQEALRSKSPLEVAEQRALLVWEAKGLLDSIRDDAVKHGDPKARESFLKSIRLVAELLDRSEQNVEEISSKIEKRDGELFVLALMAGYRALSSEMDKRGVKVPEEEAVEILEIAAEVGLAELERHVLPE